MVVNQWGDKNNLINTVKLNNELKGDEEIVYIIYTCLYYILTERKRGTITNWNYINKYNEENLPLLHIQ